MPIIQCPIKTASHAHAHTKKKKSIIIITIATELPSKHSYNDDTTFSKRQKDSIHRIWWHSGYGGNAFASAIRRQSFPLQRKNCAWDVESFASQHKEAISAADARSQWHSWNGDSGFLRTNNDNNNRPGIRFSLTGPKLIVTFRYARTRTTSRSNPQKFGNLKGADHLSTEWQECCFWCKLLSSLRPDYQIQLGTECVIFLIRTALIFARHARWIVSVVAAIKDDQQLLTNRDWANVHTHPHTWASICYKCIKEHIHLCKNSRSSQTWIGNANPRESLAWPGSSRSGNTGNVNGECIPSLQIQLTDLLYTNTKNASFHSMSMHNQCEELADLLRLIS